MLLGIAVVFSVVTNEVTNVSNSNRKYCIDHIFSTNVENVSLSQKEQWKKWSVDCVTEASGTAAGMNVASIFKSVWYTHQVYTYSNMSRAGFIWASLAKNRLMKI